MGRNLHKLIKIFDDVIIMLIYEVIKMRQLKKVEGFSWRFQKRFNWCSLNWGHFRQSYVVYCEINFAILPPVQITLRSEHQSKDDITVISLSIWSWFFLSLGSHNFKDKGFISGMVENTPPPREGLRPKSPGLTVRTFEIRALRLPPPPSPLSLCHTLSPSDERRKGHS